MKKKPVVGLATCFIDNYGACLQAYALQTMIERSNCECKIIQYTQPHNYIRKTWFNQLTFNGLLIKLFDSIAGKNLLIKYGTRPKFKNFRKKYLKFTKEFSTTAAVYDANLDFDAYVCGSDQIWNPDIFGGNNPVYLLDFVPNGKKRIAYAPSIGLSEFPQKYLDDFCEKINQFDYLSVRESTGKEIVQALTQKEVKHVLDPTLLLNGNEWGRLALSVKLSEPYIFCYLFGEVSYISEFVEYARKNTGMPVVCIPFTEREKNSDYIKVYDAGPQDFLGLIKNAALVITDSFHATAFSINFNVPFYSLLRSTNNEKNNMNSRIYSILELTQLQERLVEDDVKYPFDININMDFTNANRLLDEKRSLDFGDLKQQLEDII